MIDTNDPGTTAELAAAIAQLKAERDEILAALEAILALEPDDEGDIILPTTSGYGGWPEFADAKRSIAKARLTPKPETRISAVFDPIQHHLAQLRDERDAARHALADLERRPNQPTTEKTMIDENDTHTAELAAAIAQLKAERDEILAALEAQASDIRALRADIADLEERAAEAAEAAAEAARQRALRADIADFEERAARQRALRADIADLEERAAEAARRRALRADIADLEERAARQRALRADIADFEERVAEAAEAAAERVAERYAGEIDGYAIWSEIEDRVDEAAAEAARQVIRDELVASVDLI